MICSSPGGQCQRLKAEYLFVAGTLASKPIVRHSRDPRRMRVDLPLHQVFPQGSGEQENICHCKMFPESVEENTLWTPLTIYFLAAFLFCNSLM